MVLKHCIGFYLYDSWHLTAVTYLKTQYATRNSGKQVYIKDQYTTDIHLNTMDFFGSIHKGTKLVLIKHFSPINDIVKGSSNFSEKHTVPSRNTTRIKMHLSCKQQNGFHSGLDQPKWNMYKYKLCSKSAGQKQKKD